MADLGSDIPAPEEVPAPSRAIRDVRIAQGLSLRALSARAGLPYSTLSKLENGKMTLTYDKLIRLAQALNVDIRDMLAAPVQTSAPVAVGRRSITRAGEGLDADSEKHMHHYPAADLLGKIMIPIVIDVKGDKQAPQRIFDMSIFCSAVIDGTSTQVPSRSKRQA